jgi:hypothetical protein
MNAAAVFKGPSKSLPRAYKGIQVIDGDLHDLRFLDEKGVIVGLRAKGKAVYDRSGFVIGEEAVYDEPTGFNIDATEKGLSTC